METAQFILVETFCVHHNIDISFINSLQEFGLVEITTKENVAYITDNNLKTIEQLIRLHNDLNINLEGMDAIVYLLDRLKNKEEEIMELRNRLRFYEAGAM